jgi:hypothetical protein
MLVPLASRFSAVMGLPFQAEWLLAEGDPRLYTD